MVVNNIDLGSVNWEGIGDEIFGKGPLPDGFRSDRRTVAKGPLGDTTVYHGEIQRAVQPRVNRSAPKGMNRAS